MLLSVIFYYLILESKPIERNFFHLFIVISSQVVRFSFQIYPIYPKYLILCDLVGWI